MSEYILMRRSHGCATNSRSPATITPPTGVSAVSASNALPIVTVRSNVHCSGCPVAKRGEAAAASRQASATPTKPFGRRPLRACRIPADRSLTPESDRDTPKPRTQFSDSRRGVAASNDRAAASVPGHRGIDEMDHRGQPSGQRHPANASGPRFRVKLQRDSADQGDVDPAVWTTVVAGTRVACIPAVGELTCQVSELGVCRYRRTLREFPHRLAVIAPRREGSGPLGDSVRWHAQACDRD